MIHINYTEQTILKTEVLPETEFPTDVLVLDSNHSDRRQHAIQEDEYYWTNDDPSSMYKTGIQPGSVEATVHNQFVDSTLTDPYKYDCIHHKSVYIVNNIDFSDEITCTIRTPDYEPVPYVFDYKITIADREMNYFNMYISYNIAKLVEEALFEWINDFRNPLLIPIRNINAGFHGPSQIITNFPVFDLSEQKPKESKTKIQMCIKPEYLFWTIETLVRHYDELRAAGMLAFKFLYLVGECKMNACYEIYPDPKPGESINERELLNAPTIVIYIENDTIGKLVRLLCSLFPNEAEISSGVPRFNIRINDNVCLSEGGNNQFKYDGGLEYVPTEYEMILNSPELLVSHANFSRYLTGNDIVYPRSSYKKILTSGSFRDVFEKYGLVEYYTAIFTKLDLKILNVEYQRPLEKLQLPTYASEGPPSPEFKPVKAEQTKRVEKKYTNVRPIQPFPTPGGSKNNKRKYNGTRSRSMHKKKQTRNRLLHKMRKRTKRTV